MFALSWSTLVRIYFVAGCKFADNITIIGPITTMDRKILCNFIRCNIESVLSGCIMAWYTLPLDDAWAGLRLVLRVFQDSDWSTTDDTSSQKHLADQSRVPPVCDVILSDVTVQVSRLQQPVVHTHECVYVCEEEQQQHKQQQPGKDAIRTVKDREGSARDSGFPVR
eukprot:superscaffoldBa00001181_g9375